MVDGEKAVVQGKRLGNKVVHQLVLMLFVLFVELPETADWQHLLIGQERVPTQCDAVTTFDGTRATVWGRLHHHRRDQVRTNQNGMNDPNVPKMDTATIKAFIRALKLTRRHDRPTTAQNETDWNDVKRHRFPDAKKIDTLS